MLSLPQEISFNYTPKAHMTSTLKLTNLEDHPIIFKVKTNAPSHYLLSAHTGVIHSQSSTETTITMKPISYNPQNGSMNDVFLVQAIALPRKTDLASFFNLAKFQEVFAETPKSSVENYKLKVVLKLDSLSSSSSPRIENPESLRDSINSADFKSFRGNESYCLDGLDSETLAMSFGHRLSTGSNPHKDLFTPGPGNPDSSFELGSSRISLTESQTWLRFAEEKAEKSEDKETGEGSECSREEELMRKSEKQKQLMFELAQENTRLKDELMNLKSTTFHAVAKRNEKLNLQNEFQLWHVLLTAIFGMMLGALLTP